jgi:hypothetical protein
LGSEHYTARAIKGTALLEETRALLRAWRPGESAAAFRERARAEDLLGKATAARTDDVVQVAFAGRLLVDGQEPATSLQRLLEARGSGPWFSQLCLLFAARVDVVLREAVTEFLPRVRARQSDVVATADFISFLDDQHAGGRMARPWSRTVRERVAQHVLHQLTDFGVLGAPRRGIRTVLPYRVGSLALAWLACDLHRRDISDSSLVEHGDWRVWQLGREDVRDALDRLSDLGLWIYQGAGSVVRIAWTWADWKDVLAVLENPSID